jgi:hypothetical protein
LAIRAAATRNGLYDLDLFAVFTDDQVPDVDDAIETGVGALESGVVRLYGVVVILSGWVRWARGRLLCGHWRLTLLWPGGPGLLWSAPGPRLYLTPLW